MRATRRSVPSRLGLIALLAATSMVLSGCFIRTFLGYVDEEGVTSVSGTMDVSLCEPSADPLDPVTCTYTVDDGDGDTDSTSAFFRILSGQEIVGLIIDPLIVQVPQDAGSVVATYNDAGTQLPLVVTVTDTFNVTPSTSVTAESGTKFLIVELPDTAVAGLSTTPTSFDFSLRFTVNDPSGVSVKPMLTARIDQGGAPYYLPLIPCVTDFAQVPSIQISGGPSFADLLPQVRDIAATQTPLACDGVTYDLSVGGPASTVATTLAPTTTAAPASSTTAAPTTAAPTSAAAPTTAAPTSAAPTTPATLAPDDDAAGVTTTVSPLDVTLPATGSSTGMQLWVALIFLAAGAAVIAASRRHA